MTHLVIVPDATRPLDVERAVRPVLAADSEILVGLGLHRRMSDAELAPLRVAASDVPIRQHDPDAPTNLKTYDRITVVGVVEPHQYAGFSGGVKGIVIGCGSRRTIAEMHSLPMLNACNARVGWLEGNPFQERLWELAEGLPPIDAVFEVPGHPDLVVGAVRTAFDEAVEIARSLHFRRLDSPLDSILLEVPAPKDVNFYQASRAATYVALAERPAIKQCGTIYLRAACPEGIGRGSGERACAEAMQRGADVLLAELRSPSPPATRGGEQRAYVLAMALEVADIVLVRSGAAIPELDAMGIAQQATTPAVDLTISEPFQTVLVTGD